MAKLPDIVVITVVRDEADMLPRWVRHYARQCGDPERLLVVDDNTTDGSTAGLPCPVIRLPERHHAEWSKVRLRIVNSLASGLLQAFDAAVFVDADEFLVADPEKYADLRELVADRPGTPALAAMGLNVVHRVGVEGPLEPDRPLLRQRPTAKFIPKMCKPAIKLRPVRWSAGSHGIRTAYSIDPDLYMFHLKFADRDHLAASAAHRKRLTEELGRGLDANWRLGDQLVDLLDGLGAPSDLDAVPWFTPQRPTLERIVKNEGRLWRSRGRGQVRAMRGRPLVRIPEPLLDAV